MPPELIMRRADKALFSALKEQWQSQMGEDSDYYATLMEHAERIAGEDPPDRKYGIFVLEKTCDTGAEYEAFVHVNYAPQHPEGPTLRMVWNLLAPKYESDFPETDLASITASFLYGGIELCHGEMKANGLRVYLHNALDLRYAAGVAGALQHSGVKTAVRGQWMYIEI